MKMILTRKRPGKKIEEITDIHVLDNQGKELAYIHFSHVDHPDPNLEIGSKGPYHIVIVTQDERLWIDVAHPSNDGEWCEHPPTPR